MSLPSKENQTAESSAKSDKPTSLACPICGKEFSSEKRYFGHLRIHSGDILYPCDKCPSSAELFDSQSRLKTHENSCHDLARRHKCSRCDSVFDRASQLDYHRRSVHLGEKSQICQICGKGFFRKTDLRTHLNVHLGTNQSICEICGQKFNHVSNLIRHCRTHAGSKPYPCVMCGKRFTQISSLARHKRIHERESRVAFDKDENDGESSEPRYAADSKAETKKIAQRQHYCRMCGESFRFMILLRQHERLHFKAEENRRDKVNDEERSSTENSKEAEQAEISSDVSSTSDWRDFNAENEGDSNDLTEREPNSIQDHLLELDRKMNAIEIETERDVSISISDILSPYNCDEIELTDGDELEHKSYGNPSGMPKLCGMEKEYDMAHCLSSVDFSTNIDPELLEVSNEKSTVRSVARLRLQSREIVKSSSGKSLASLTRDQHSNKCLHVEGSQLYIEICESEYLKSTSLQALELQEIENVGLPLEVFQVTDAEGPQSTRTSYEEKIPDKRSSSEDEESDDRPETLGDEEPTLRLVQTETGEQFYELIINNRCSEDFESVEAERAEKESSLQDDSSISEPRLSIPADHHPSATAELSRVDYMENPTSELEPNSNEFLELLPHSEICKESHAASSQNEAQMPMVRLVQNEDGEQFFELIREPLEYERNRIAGEAWRDEKSLENRADETVSNFTIGNEKLQVAPTNSGYKKEKRENTAESVQRPAKDRSRKFQCNECDKWFSTAYNFKQHAGTHFSDQQQFQCKECGLSFAWKSTLNKHLAGNHRPDGPQKFVCEICPKVYSTLSQVNEHVKRDHLKERNHVCPNCGKSFFKKFDLKTHSRTHTNERPYVCRACGKRFHHQSHIIRHERIHSGERPYACNICQRTFTQPGSLKSHRQRHRDVKIDILEYRMDEDDPMSLAVQ